MICSWLDHKSGIGNFFIDQANFLSGNFNFILINFKPVTLRFKNLKLIAPIFKIETYIYNDNITILYFHYPKIKLFKSDLFKNQIENHTLFLLTKYLKRNRIKINLIHAQSIFDASFWTFKFFKKTKTPYLISEHNQFTLRNTNKNSINIFDQIFQNSKNNLVVSNDLIRQFASNGFFYDFVNIGNAIDTTFFNYEKKTENTNFEIITIGAYTPVKDQITLLKALKIIDGIDGIKMQIKFTWLGYNSWGADFDGKVHDLINSFDFKKISIKLLKIASKEEVKLALKQSDLFVSTSLCESFGISALESISVGTPVIATISGGTSEFINENNGLLIPIRAHQKLALAIEKILNNEIQFDSEKMAQEVANQFGKEAFTDKMKSIYDTAIMKTTF